MGSRLQMEGSDKTFSEGTFQRKKIKGQMELFLSRVDGGVKRKKVTMGGKG